MRKNGVKIVYILFILILSLLITSCTSSRSNGNLTQTQETSGNNKDNNSSRQEVLVWEMYGPDRNMDGITDAFNESQDKIFVIDEFIPGHTELIQKLQVTAASNSRLPNAILIDMIYVPTINEMVELVDMSKFLENDPNIKAEDFYNELLKYGNIDGKQVSLHAYGNNLILYYNKLLFKEAGLDPNHPPETWAELVDYAKAMTKDGQWGYHMTAYTDSYYESISWQYQVLVWQNGGEMWDEKWQPKFNSPEGIEALQFMVDLVNKYKVATTAPPENGFQQGKIAMIMDGTWMGKEYLSSLKDNLGTAPLPYNKERATNTGGEHWMIVSSDESTEAATWEYVSYMLSEEVVTEICSNGGQVPTRRSIAESQKFLDFANTQPAIKTSMESMEFARMRASSPNYSAASEAISTYIQQAIFGQMSVEDALTKAETAWKEAINK